MFNKLIASQGGRRGFWSPRTVTMSVAVHGLLLAGAVYATVGGPVQDRAAEEEVTFIEIQENEPEPPQAEEPPPPPPEQPVAPPPPQGFQELLPPLEAPPEIPDVDLSEPAVDAADFSGVGIAGGTADGVEGGTPQNTARDSTFAYEPAVLEVQPKLNNLRDVQRALTRNYPRMLQDAGIGGQTIMQFVITETGQVDPSSVEVVQASHEQFRDASTRVVETFRFDPGRYQGQPVRVLIRMPITWQTK